MILHHIANRAGLFVEGSAPSHSEILSHGDLHTIHKVAVPHRLEYEVRKAENQKVLHRRFSQIVVDPENMAFVEYRVENLVQLPRGLLVSTEWFLDNDPGS